MTDTIIRTHTADPQLYLNADKTIPRYGLVYI